MGVVKNSAKGPLAPVVLREAGIRTPFAKTMQKHRQTGPLAEWLPA